MGKSRANARAALGTTAVDIHERFMIWAQSVEALGADPRGLMDGLDRTMARDPVLYDLIVRSALKTAMADEQDDPCGRYRRAVREHFGCHQAIRAESKALERETGTGRGASMRGRI